jgi:hypothetical protein
MTAAKTGELLVELKTYVRLDSLTRPIRQAGKPDLQVAREGIR